MTRRQENHLLPLVESFFLDHLRRICGASPHTVRAYRDSLSLLFSFVAQTKGCSVADLQLNDLHVDAVVAFLTQLEAKRKNTVATRNYRLAAIKSFFKHLIRHDLLHAEQYHRVLALPPKKTKLKLAFYLEPEEVRQILAKPNRATALGLRDYALLLFCYNTGARVSELLAVRVGDLHLTSPRQVLLHGKGKKDRIIPLWRETSTVLQRLETVRNARPGDLVFLNTHGESLTRDGVAYILHKYVTIAMREMPALGRGTITPHVIRHSCAVALLQAGNDVTVIRDYLGHTSIATTNRYLTTNLEMKRDVLEAFWRRAGLSPTRTKYSGS